MRKFINYIQSETFSDDDKYKSFKSELGNQILGQDVLNK